MHYKNQFFILLIGLGIFQFMSCTKDSETIDINNQSRPVAAAAGNFHCQKKSSSGYSSISQYLSMGDSSDVVIQISMNDSTLYFGDLYEFRIDSDNQTYFESGENPSGVSLEFKNNYDSLVISYSSSYQGGGASSKYYGSKSQLLTSDIPHAYNSTLEGNYTLNIHKTNSATGLDTQYTNTLFVSYGNGGPLTIGNFQAYPGIFHSHMESNKYQNYGSLHYRTEQSLYWTNDSIFYEVDSIYYPQLDTVYCRFSGTK